MKIVIQRVAEASVKVEDRIVGAIGQGLCLLVGIHAEDTIADVNQMVKRILSIRLFPHASEDAAEEDSVKSQWKTCITESDRLAILAVSQFTLMALTDKGSKPNFYQAMAPEPARALFDTFVQALRNALGRERVATGAFGERMRVSLVNDGPVTIILDSRKNK